MPLLTASPVCGRASPCRALVAADPDVLDANVAERFVVGLEDVSKAHAGLTAMVKWLKVSPENDMLAVCLGFL